LTPAEIHASMAIERLFDYPCDVLALRSWTSWP
jgi:hypothetical protein